MIEFTLTVGEKVYIGRDIFIELIEKTHPKAISAQVARVGIHAPVDVNIVRGELPRVDKTNGRSD